MNNFAPVCVLVTSFMTDISALHVFCSFKYTFEGIAGFQASLSVCRRSPWTLSALRQTKPHPEPRRLYFLLPSETPTSAFFLNSWLELSFLMPDHLFSFSWRFMWSCFLADLNQAAERKGFTLLSFKVKLLLSRASAVWGQQLGHIGCITDKLQDEPKLVWTQQATKRQEHSERTGSILSLQTGFKGLSGGFGWNEWCLYWLYYTGYTCSICMQQQSCDILWGNILAA